MMSKTIKYISSIAFAGLALGSQVTMAATVAGITFDDNAYVDVLLGSSGSYADQGNNVIDTTQLAVALTDTDAATGAWSTDINAYVQLGFTDNLMVNGTGADLVLFELGAPGDLAVSLKVTVILNGTAQIFETSPTYYHIDDSGVVTPGLGDPDDLKVNSVGIDLSTFGILPDATVSDFYVGFDVVGAGSTKPILSLAAALHSTAVPVPAAVWLFGSGLLALVGIARRHKKTA